MNQGGWGEWMKSNFLYPMLLHSRKDVSGNYVSWPTHIETILELPEKGSHSTQSLNKSWHNAELSNNTAS